MQEAFKGFDLGQALEEGLFFLARQRAFVARALSSFSQPVAFGAILDMEEFKAVDPL